MALRYLVTGGAGFIGSAVVRRIIGQSLSDVLVADKLTYAGNLDSLAPVASNSRYAFLQLDILDAKAIRRAIGDFHPDVIMHLAAESHVDRSIEGPAEFMRTNIGGTFTLLQAALQYWQTLRKDPKILFRFHHISTDEVYGSLGPTGQFSEDDAYAPSSPYAASKASSDHLVRAWHHTYGLPVVMTHCSNNYGPYHFPEKLIPLTIINALQGKPLMVYGKGDNVRDWLHVDDHAEALLLVAERGRVGGRYNIGGHNEFANLDVVRQICALVDEFAPDSMIGQRADLIRMVADRPGHDFRYAIDSAKITRELGWKPRHAFASGLRQTVRWYLDNEHWWKRARANICRAQRPTLSPDPISVL